MYHRKNAGLRRDHGIRWSVSWRCVSSISFRLQEIEGNPPLATENVVGMFLKIRSIKNQQTENIL